MMRRATGFTLIELIVTVAVLAIVATIAVPSYTALVESNRVTASSNRLVSALQFARTEAVKRNDAVNVCARSASGDKSCGGTTSWSSGWVVWHDADDNGTRTDDEVVQVWSGVPDALDVSAGGGSVSFDREGFAGAVTTFTVAPSDCDSGRERITVTLEATGRPGSARSDCP